MHNKPHNPAPEPRRIDDVALLANCGNDIIGDLFRRGGEFWRQLHVFGHGSGDKAGLDGNDVNSFGRQTVAKPGQKRREPRLGTAVEVISRPPPVAGHGTYTDYEPLAAFFKSVRGQGEYRHEPGEIGLKQRLGRRPVTLRFALIPQYAYGA